MRSRVKVSLSSYTPFSTQCAYHIISLRAKKSDSSLRENIIIYCNNVLLKLYVGTVQYAPHTYDMMRKMSIDQ